MVNFPTLVLVSSFIVLWFSARIGAFVCERRGRLEEGARKDFDVVQAATLTLLGLLIGFTFSMAISRYDQRKNYEAEEANAIGTEYVRAGLLPAANGARVRELLVSYLDQRVLFYTTRDTRRLQQVDTDTARLQNELWSAAQAGATAQPTAIVALALGGMNELLNSEGYTQAAWRNRIPVAAWALMGFIAICCNLLIGYGARGSSSRLLFVVTPLAVSVSFFLIADLDSPRWGVIHVHPYNLLSLLQTLHTH
jgi:hypothetical protein